MDGPLSCRLFSMGVFVWLEVVREGLEVSF